VLHRSLSLHLLVFYLLFVGPVITAALLFQHLTSQGLEADIRAADLALAGAVAQETNGTTEAALQAVRQLADYPAVIAADPVGMGSLFETLMDVRADINLVYRLDSRGIMLYHYPTGPESTVGVDFSFRDYFQKALTTHQPVFSQGRISPTTNQPVATAVMPLWSAEDQFLGLVGTNVRLDSLSHALDQIVGGYDPQERPQLFILDAAGQIIAHPDRARLLSDVNAALPQVVPAVLSGQSGNLVVTGTDRVEELVSFTPINSVGWGVIVGRPTAVAFASLHAFRRGVFIASAIFLVGGLFFWLILTRQVFLPLERLARYSQAIGRDATAASDEQTHITTLARRPDQIGYLTRSLQRMQVSIRDRLNELSILLQTSGEVVSTLDSGIVLGRILEQVQRLLDIEMCAIFARDEEKGIFRIFASRGLPGRYTDIAIINPNEPGSVTMRAIHSGQPIQVSDTETNPSFKAHRERARIAGYRSVLAIPLRVQHSPPAALLVFRPEPHEFTEREIGLLDSFANHAAMAIENAALYARSDMRLQEQTRRLESLIQSMQDGLVLEDPEGRVLYANRRMAELSGVPPDEFGGRRSAELMEDFLQHAQDREAAEAAVKAALSGQADRTAEFALTYPDRARYMRLKVFDVTDTQGTLIGRGRILQDITQRYELDRMKSGLISTVSHELRTPLAAIKGYASTLLAEDVEWDLQSQHEFLNIISVETDHLSDLVNDLLDMSRIEAGNLSVSRVECDLKEVAERAALRARVQPGQLHLEIPATFPALFADPRRIEVVLRNLIENAAKYGEPQSPVWVRGEWAGGNVVIRVEDNGPGIPAEFSNRVFDSFFRADAGLARSTPGVGLGLSIAQGFVRAHGGQVWLEPKPVGTCVAFSLPLHGDQSTGAAGL
jgi:PAS domain S-box-containing protein